MLIKTWDARTRHPAQRTRVRRGRTPRRGRDAVDRASVPCHAAWQLPNRADAAEIGAEAVQIGPTRSVSAISVNIGRRPIRSKQAGICQNRLKSAVKIAGEAEILTSDAFLALFFLCFVNQVDRKSVV